jgi:hypothetical protein
MSGKPSIKGCASTHVTTIQADSSTSSGTTYAVTVQDYLDRKFDHWNNGCTNRTRTLTISEAANITAFYQTG